MEGKKVEEKAVVKKAEDKRKLHEIKLITILAVLCIAVYGVAIGLKVALPSEEDLAITDLDVSGAITTMEFSAADEQFSVAKRGIDWVSPERENVPLNQTLVSSITKCFAAFEPDRKVEDASSFFPQFGLASPQYKVTVTTAGEKRTYILGNYNDILGQYYVSAEGDDSAYLVDKRQVEKWNKTFLNLVSVPSLFNADSSTLDEIIVDNGEDSYKAFKSGENFKIEHAGKTSDCNKYALSNIYYALKNVKYETCVSCDADASELAVYGLKNPAITATVRLQGGESYDVKISAVKDGISYTTVGNESIIYKITEEEVATVVEKTAVGRFFE